ncbi:hypothetical protein GYMLUDRAFT_487265 [Collybiopsis luxurians FD-317 M1]|uniref:Uncharacterized protein n=1 Tax=Collybiopsis luxurians FD-317 M1 TaxID=944289 RepID=A0A0D0C658_9AGAR|nr:hypothetical protein GYMLUDRAFT_487265 [Collybiopsis luxurians FD-317 M1]
MYILFLPADCMQTYTLLFPLSPNFNPLSVMQDLRLFNFAPTRRSRLLPPIAYRTDVSAMMIDPHVLASTSVPVTSEDDIPPGVIVIGILKG